MLSLDKNYMLRSNCQNFHKGMYLYVNIYVYVYKKIESFSLYVGPYLYKKTDHVAH